MKRSFSFLRSPLVLGLVTLLASAAVATGALTGETSPSAAAATTWVKDYHYTFNSPHNERKWGRYGWGYQPVGHGAMGVYKPDNVFTRDGKLVLRTIYRDGRWSSAGVSNNPGFSAVGGKWEVRAKMPRAKGIGYAFLLMPADGTWPPEVDIAEGRVNGPRVEHFYHYGSASNHKRGMVVSKTNTHEWHTYGVILDGTTVTFTLDGARVGRITNVPVTKKRLWLG